MKYWLFLAGKAAAAALLMYGVWQGLVHWIPEPEPLLSYRVSRWNDVRWSAILLVFWLVSVGLGALIVVDHKYRCRTCLRRLRMPLPAGSWPSSLLRGAPRTEYICPYGHGTLRVPGLQIAGLELSDWRAHEDIWKELRSLERSNH